MINNRDRLNDIMKTPITIDFILAFKSFIYECRSKKNKSGVFYYRRYSFKIFNIEVFTHKINLLKEKPLTMEEFESLVVNSFFYKRIDRWIMSKINEIEVTAEEITPNGLIKTIK